MDIKKTVRFIKNSRGLYLNTKIFYKSLILLPAMFLLVLVNTQGLGKNFAIASVFVLLFILFTDTYYWLILVKNPLPKYKLLLRGGVLLNCVAPLFYICCLTFYDAFGPKSFLLYYLLPFFVISFVFVIIGCSIALRARDKKTNVFYALVCCILLAFSALISRKLNSVMAEKLSENAHFSVIAVLMLLAFCFAFSVVFLDILRYCCFVKLEKAGLVTEDILTGKTDNFNGS